MAQRIVPARFALALVLLSTVPTDAGADVIFRPGDEYRADECVRGGAGAPCIEQEGRAGRCRWFPSRRGYYCTPLTECERRDAGASCRPIRGRPAHCVPVADAGRGWPNLACVGDDQAADVATTAHDASAPDAAFDVAPPRSSATPSIEPAPSAGQPPPTSRCSCTAAGAGSAGRALWGVAAAIGVILKNAHRNKRAAR
ncbi:MAG: hypothetical protein JNK05_37805 [Myxococcales bacterium]|nr:hypothetical protein [Myxococcales bacterium]